MLNVIQCTGQHLLVMSVADRSGVARDTRPPVNMYISPTCPNGTATSAAQANHLPVRGHLGGAPQHGVIGATTPGYEAPATPT